MRTKLRTYYESTPRVPYSTEQRMRDANQKQQQVRRCGRLCGSAATARRHSQRRQRTERRLRARPPDGAPALAHRCAQVDIALLARRVTSRRLLRRELSWPLRALLRERGSWCGGVRFSHGRTMHKYKPSGRVTLDPLRAWTACHSSLHRFTHDSEVCYQNWSAKHRARARVRVPPRAGSAASSVARGEL